VCKKLRKDPCSRSARLSRIPRHGLETAGRLEDGARAALRDGSIGPHAHDVVVPVALFAARVLESLPSAAPGQYIASVIYQGGFTGNFVRNGDFCTFYYHEDPMIGPVCTPLDCMDTRSQASLPGASAFVPDAPLPPATANAVFIVGANGVLWSSLDPADVGGSLSIWLCVQKGVPVS